MGSPFWFVGKCSGHLPVTFTRFVPLHLAIRSLCSQAGESNSDVTTSEVTKVTNDFLGDAPMTSSFPFGRRAPPPATPTPGLDRPPLVA